mgnify:CR=1 FL=1
MAFDEQMGWVCKRLHHMQLVVVSADQVCFLETIMPMHTCNYILVLGSWIKKMMRGWITTVDKEDKNSNLKQSFHLS